MKRIKGCLLFLAFLTQSHLIFGQNPDHEAWKIQREKELLAEDGWLNLAGFHWITEENAFLNKIDKDSLTVTNKAAKQTLGTFQVEHDSVWFTFHPRVRKKKKIESAGTTLQFPAKTYGTGAVYFERWKWTVINRGGQFAMRLRDLEHLGLTQFQPIPYFEYDSALSLEAVFIPRFNETINIPNVLGQVIEWKVMGILKFEIEGEKYQLTAVDEEGKLFVIFSDLTNETETYPTGRYLYVNYPNISGITRVDFNYEFNPPCAFTSFATCLIPPKVNRLEIAIKAGEKEPKGH